jgi:hypothetical protein
MCVLEVSVRGGVEIRLFATDPGSFLLQRKGVKMATIGV